MANNYEWDKYEVDEAFAKLAAREFADPKNGVPEWVKNSNDAYIRADKSKGQRPITMIYSPNSKDYGTPVIACLDLVGMTIDDLSILKRWGDPTAAGSGTGIAGGHGNGGKSYSIAGFSGPTIYYTLKDSFANVYGFPEPPRPVTAWLPNGKNVKIENSLEYLESALSQIGLMPSDLPDEIQKQLPNVHGFTLLVGHGPKDFTGKFLANWTNILQNHKEMFIPLQNCEIYVISNRRLLNNGKPLTLESILPMEKYKDPLIIKVPSELTDPESGKTVSTIGDGSFS